MGKRGYRISLQNRGANPNTTKNVEERLGGDPDEVVPYVVSTESTKEAAEALQRELVAAGAIVTIRVVEITEDDSDDSDGSSSGSTDGMAGGGWAGPRMSGDDE